MDQRIRDGIKLRLADKLERASGRSVMEHGVKAWDTAADALIDAIIQIINEEHAEAATRPMDRHS